MSHYRKRIATVFAPNQYLRNLLRSTSGWLGIVLISCLSNAMAASALPASGYVFLGLSYLSSEAVGLRAGSGSIITTFSLKQGTPSAGYFVDTGLTRNLLFVGGDKWGDPAGDLPQTTDAMSFTATGDQIRTVNFHHYEVPQAQKVLIGGIVGTPFLDGRCADFNLPDHILTLSEKSDDCVHEYQPSRHVVPLFRSKLRNRVMVALTFEGVRLNLIVDTGAAARDLVLFDREVFDNMRSESIQELRMHTWGREQVCDVSRNRLQQSTTKVPFGAYVEYCRFANGETYRSSDYEGADGVLGLRQLNSRRFTLDLINNALIVDGGIAR